MTDAKRRVRTPRQNRALHLFFSMLAEELNAAGYSVKLVMEKKMDVEWDPRLIKELLWRPAQRAVLGSDSTKLLRKSEDIDRVYDTLNRFLGQHFGIHVEWPHYKPGQFEEITSSTTEA